MALTLVTGPANAAKAGAVLERLRAARPRDPLLVVPTAADVEHYQRELAGSGIVFGASVLTFRNLVRDSARQRGRRNASEHAAAREERLPSEVEMLERRFRRRHHREGDLVRSAGDFLGRM